MSSAENSQRAGGTVAVRFEGGLGDHILGMRVLPFVRRRFPGHRIVAYSDAAGGQSQLEVLALSPFVDEIQPVRKRPDMPAERIGHLDTVLGEDLAMMRGADHFFDAWGGMFFLQAAKDLEVPALSILAMRPRLVLPAAAMETARERLAQFEGKRLVGLNIAKHGEKEGPLADRIRQLLGGILADERVVILNLFQTRFDFGHWPAPLAGLRMQWAQADLQLAENLCQMDPRIVPMTDLPVAEVAAVLRRCCYFVGVDNGIKHLAWALKVPRTVFFRAGRIHLESILRWVPDFHRALPSDAGPGDVETHLNDARRAIAG